MKKECWIDSHKFEQMINRIKELGYFDLEIALRNSSKYPMFKDQEGEYAINYTHQDIKLKSDSIEIQMG